MYGVQACECASMHFVRLFVCVCACVRMCTCMRVCRVITCV